MFEKRFFAIFTQLPNSILTSTSLNIKYYHFMECLDATLKKLNIKKIARYRSFKKAILESRTITAAQTIAWQKFVA